MSLLRWKELAKSKSELGNKINYVHNTITQNKIGELTSQESFTKVFKPVTSKLDDVIDSNLNLGMPQRIKRPLRKGEVPNYGIDIEDEVEDMGLDDLFGDYVPPQQEKQIVPKPPTYEDSLADVLSQGILRRYMSIPDICLNMLRSCHLNMMTMKKLIIQSDD